METWLYSLWFFAFGLIPLAIALTIAYASNKKYAIAGGILAGIAVGFVALFAMCFANAAFNPNAGFEQPPVHSPTPVR